MFSVSSRLCILKQNVNNNTTMYFSDAYGNFWIKSVGRNSSKCRDHWGLYIFSIKYCFIEKFQHMYFEEKRWFASDYTFVLVLVHGLENGIEFKVFVNIESWVVTDCYVLHRGLKNWKIVRLAPKIWIAPPKRLIQQSY